MLKTLDLKRCLRRPKTDKFMLKIAAYSSDKIKFQGKMKCHYVKKRKIALRTKWIIK